MTDTHSTRSKLLKKMSQEMIHHGFKATRVDVVLDKVGVAKGALYHYFQDKTTLGYAVVDEVIQQLTIETWIQPIENCDDPIKALSSVIDTVFKSMTKRMITTGCPLNNLAQEMSSIDEGFRQRIDNIYTMWRTSVANALKQGQNNHLVRKDISCEKSAVFIVASIAGCIGSAKNTRSTHSLIECGESLIDYFDSLKIRN